MRLLGAAAIAAGAIALSGCGGSSSGTNADPATVTPSSASLYASVVVKPQGGSKSDALIVAKALTHQVEPYGSLAQSLLSTPSKQLNFKHDIEPWIGERAAIFLTSIDTAKLGSGATSLQGLLEGGLTGSSSPINIGVFPEGANGAMVLDTSDANAARSFVEARAREHQTHPASYRGVSYLASNNGFAAGIVHRFAVIGSEAALKSVIDTSLGAASITSAANYVKPPTNAIASAYLRPQELVKATKGSGGASLSLLGRVFAGATDASLSATPSANSISLQGTVHYSGNSAPLLGPEGARALGELPESAWLAAGIADVQSNAGVGISLLHSLTSLGASTALSSFGGASIEKLFEKLTAPGVNLQQDFAGWAGRAGLYTSGTGLFNIEAALVIDSKDPAASKAAVGKLGGQLSNAGAVVAPASIPGTDAAISVKLQGFPAVLYVANGNSKLIVGLGQNSITGALNPAKTLAGSSAASAAASALGEGIEPSLILEFPTLVGFLEGIGLSQNPSLANLMPTLKSLGTLTAGSVSEAGVQRFKLVLGLASS